MEYWQFLFFLFSRWALRSLGTQRHTGFSPLSLKVKVVPLTSIYLLSLSRSPWSQHRGAPSVLLSNVFFLFIWRRIFGLFETKRPLHYRAEHGMGSLCLREDYCIEAHDKLGLGLRLCRLPVGGPLAARWRPVGCLLACNMLVTSPIPPNCSN